MSGPSAAGAPLLLACALRIERLALRGAPARRAGRSAPGPVTVLRTGMGPDAARDAVSRALRTEPEPGRTAVLATGFCAGLVPGMRPGDLVVAEATLGGAGGETAADARTECAGTGVLTRALAGHKGARIVHTGLLAGSAHIVRGAERASLREATGALAVDMESAAVLDAATCTAVGRPVAAVRVVVDAPGHELIRFGTFRGGISAFNVLRSAVPAFIRWQHAFLLPRR